MVGKFAPSTGETTMGKYRDHREPRGRRHRDLESIAEPTYFQQRPPSRSTEAVDAEVLWFNVSKGFGFVRLTDGAEVYLHINVLEAAGSRGVTEGTLLKVNVDEGPRGLQVTQVVEIGYGSLTAPSHVQSVGGAVSETSAAVETEGTVKWYDADKGFGFISPDRGEKDIFIHATALNRAGLSGLAEGQRVLVECAQGKKGPEVRSVRLA